MTRIDIRPELDQRDNGHTYRLDPRVLHTHQSFPQRPRHRQVTFIDVFDRVVFGIVVAVVIAAAVGGLVFFSLAVTTIVRSLSGGS